MVQWLFICAMRRGSFALLVLFIAATQLGFAQKLTLLDTSQTATSFRGIAVVSNSVFWVSGSRGTVGRSVDGGKTLQWLNPKGYEHREFRDVQALNSETALVMAVDSPGIILKTTDAGLSWREVFRNDEPGIFLDDMHFTGNYGMCVGDAMRGRMHVLRTTNGGDTWQTMEGPLAIGAEGCFAASGSNLLVTRKQSAFVTGGANARIHIYKGGKWTSRHLPIMQGTVMTGPNSLRPLSRTTWVAVGGDYNSRLRSDSSWVLLKVKSPKAQSKHSLPYCSVVVPLTKKQFLAAGLNGWFLAEKKKGKWMVTPINTTAAHTAQRGEDGKTIFAAGPRGHIMKMEWK